MAVVTVAVCLLLQIGIIRLLDAELPPFITYYPGIMLVAILCGRGPGIVSTVLASLASVYFVMPSRGLAFERPSDLFTVFVFVAVGVSMSLIAERYRRSQQSLAAYEAEKATWVGNQRLESALANMADAVWITDVNGHFTHLNDAFAKFHRFKDTAECPRETSDYMKFCEQFTLDGELIPPEMWAVPKALRGESTVDAERMFRRKDTGETWFASYSVSPIPGEDGGITGAAAVARDITERKQAEELLRESERQFHALADAIPQLCWMANGDGWTYWYNQRWYDYTGTKPKDMEGWGWQSVHDPAALPGVLKKWQVSISTGEPFDMVLPLRGGDGVYRPFLTRINPLKDADGSVLRWFGTNTDISAQQKAQENIENLNRVLGVLSDVNQTIVREKDPQAMMDAVCQIGVEKGKFRMAWIGMADPQTHLLTPVAWSGKVDEYLNRIRIDVTATDDIAGPAVLCFQSGEHTVCNDIEHDLNRPWKDYALQLGYRSLAAFPLKYGGESIGVVSFYSSELGFFNDEEVKLLDETAMDVSHALEVRRGDEERKRAEAELRWRTAFFEAQVESSSDGVLVVDGSGRKILQNQRLNELFKIPQDVSENPDDVQQRKYVATVVKDAAQFAEKVNYLMAHTEDVSRDEVELTDGTILDRYSSPVRDKANHYYGRIWTFRDITEQRQLEEQYRQAQKMEAVGQLTGGIAHDFNNLLTVVQGCAEFIGEGVRDNPRLSKMADMILGAAKRGAELTQRMLAFARRQSLQSRAVNVNQLLVELESFLQRTLGAEIALDLIQGSGDVEAFVDPNQLESAILNLCVNARDAMPGGGKLTIETHCTALDTDYAKQNAEVIPGQYVLVAVSDTGSGISAENLQRVFDPFFTTKGVGKGTGLGLSMVYGFAKQSKGHVKIYSEPWTRHIGKVVSSDG